ncbi:hypothetical protein DSO57_1000139 [Entomophthora muscae]|uniref:Uncharacterized protein n=1 Tax=Entomophthora muscae TaxID=34485 RepID=A0ACC2SMC8_9FUNG|nr:hypothetical protein DSO57_1000139 [Entomophthora muscae]
MCSYSWIGLCVFIVVSLELIWAIYLVVAFQIGEETPYKSEFRNPYLYGQYDVKDVKLSETMVLREGVFWSRNSSHFTQHHLVPLQLQHNTKCAKKEAGVMRCDTEEMRIFRWASEVKLTPVECKAYAYCQVPIHVFTTHHTHIPFKQIGRFPINGYVRKRKNITFHARLPSASGLSFRGPGSRGIWWKPLLMYFQGYSIIYTNNTTNGKRKYYNHTVTLEIEPGLIDVIYGLTDE